MKVAFCIRSDWSSIRGGDTIQLLKTREYLERLYPVQVRIVDSPQNLDARQFDICHIFNLQTIAETTAYVGQCKASRTRIAISSILWDFSAVVAHSFLVNNFGVYALSEFNINFCKRLLEKLTPLFNKPTIYTPSYRKYLAEVVTAADLLLPNSREEGAFLRQLSGVEGSTLVAKIYPVVNAVSSSDLDESRGSMEALFDRYSLPAGFVLQVARIEPGKNQYGLLMALERERHLPLLFIGNQTVAPNYFRKVRELAEKRGNVYFIDEIDHDLLPVFYRKAAVHVLPSLGETTGLVSLEALANGCRAVVSDSRFCPFDSYFQGRASSTNPLSYSAIRESVLTELSTVRDMAVISTEVRKKYSWEEAARQTFAAYQQLLAAGK